MTVPTIFDTCRPRADVLTGAMTEADFAADLAQVILGEGHAEYLDPARFFAHTYPTRGLKNLLANVCRRLTGAGGEVASIFRLDTTYGGGKSHGLIALCHAARGMRGVSGITEFVDPSLLPRGPVRIAAFDGENADPANGRKMENGLLAYTPWGEIAYALAGHEGYARVRTSDERRIAPGAVYSGRRRDRTRLTRMRRARPRVIGTAECVDPLPKHRRRTALPGFPLIDDSLSRGAHPGREPRLTQAQAPAHRPDADVVVDRHRRPSERRTTIGWANRPPRTSGRCSPFPSRPRRGSSDIFTAPAALYAFHVAVVRVPGAVQLMQTSPAALSSFSWPHEVRRDAVVTECRAVSRSLH